MRQDIAGTDTGDVRPPTPTSLRMRIAETGIQQFKVAHLLGMSDAQLSRILRERRRADELMLQRIAAAIEDVASAA